LSTFSNLPVHEPNKHFVLLELLQEKAHSFCLVRFPRKKWFIGTSFLYCNNNNEEKKKFPYWNNSWAINEHWKEQFYCALLNNIMQRTLWEICAQNEILLAYLWHVYIRTDYVVLMLSEYVWNTSLDNNETSIRRMCNFFKQKFIVLWLFSQHSICALKEVHGTLRTFCVFYGCKWFKFFVC
jgi:hypothetical protein